MYLIGVDLGQRQDFSAVAVLERVEAVTEGFDPVLWRPVRKVDSGLLVVRHLERLRLGTPYTEVVERVVGVARSTALRGARRLIVDATGVGMPVVDMLRAARPGCELMPVLLTGGAGERYDGSVYHVPKVDVLAALQAALERQELKIARALEESGTLVRELLDVRQRTTRSGRRRLGADGHGEHDDLVMAVALGCWAADRGTAGEKGDGRIV